MFQGVHNWDGVKGDWYDSLPGIWDLEKNLGSRGKKQNKEDDAIRPFNVEKLGNSPEAVLGLDVQMMPPSSCVLCKTVPVLLNMI